MVSSADFPLSLLAVAGLNFFPFTRCQKFVHNSRPQFFNNSLCKSIEQVTMKGGKIILYRREVTCFFARCTENWGISFFPFFFSTQTNKNWLNASEYCKREKLNVERRGVSLSLSLFFSLSVLCSCSCLYLHIIFNF
eukprot:Lithocolla_globosa_v1_NODE_9539_length_693_cov_54.119122.p1 type:complete len:137 gc:universal NODE_9539_length_693_cov_54.119122:531-121(-)